MDNTDDIKSRELDLTYPCVWQYKVIASALYDIEPMVKKILSGREYKLSPSKESKGYKSYSLKVTVHNEEDRKGIYEALGLDKDVKFVL